MGARTRRGLRIGAPTCLVAATLALTSALGTGAAFGAPTGASGASGASGPAATKVVRVRLKSHQPFTPAGVVLKAGDSVAVTTSGTIVFGGGLNDPKSPGGIAWGKECDAVFKAEAARKRPWPAPGLRCWSMIGKVGAGPAFEIGTAKTFRVTDPGPLYLGINDNFVGDNQGHWFATITVNKPGAVTTPTTPATAPASKKKSSSSMLTYVIIGALLLLVILFVGFLVARRRRDTDDEPEPLPSVLVGAPVAMPTEPAPDPFEVASMSAGPIGAAPLPESIDVNIFDVEFSNGLTLRVGYNHFPEGIDLRWKVTQSRIPVATGRFVTKGGGSTNHFETVPLGVKLEGREVQPDGADVQFDWMINDVPFRYSVRRDPNC